LILRGVIFTGPANSGENMSFNSHLQELIGRKITGVVAMESTGRPACKIHLVLEGGGYFEFYGQDFHNAKGCWPGGLTEARSTEHGYYTIAEEFGG